MASHQGWRNHRQARQHARLGRFEKYKGKDLQPGIRETAKLSEVLLQLNETSLSQLRRDHTRTTWSSKIAQASK